MTDIFRLKQILQKKKTVKNYIKTKTQAAFAEWVSTNIEDSLQDGLKK